MDDSDRPEGQIEVLVDLGVPYVRLADYRAMQRRCADELAALKGFDPVKALALMGERDSAIRGLETARREFDRQLAETAEYYRQANSDTEAEQLRARVAELESQLAAQQWRPGSETPAADWYQNEEGRQIAEANSQDIAAKLKAIVAEIHEQYLKIGYHTFGYWIRFGGDAVLSDALSDFVEELYPTEWAAAWEPFANDEAALSRDPRPACQEA